MEVNGRIEVIFRRVFKNPNLTIRPEFTAKDVKGWDSLHHMSLIVEIEKEFSIKFQAGDVIRLRTVGDLIRVVHEKMGLRVSPQTTSH
jgi:acyl carrier protein